MAEYFSPGVYVEEYDNTPRSIEGVGTSTAGFIGFAEKGAAVGAPIDNAIGALFLAVSSGVILATVSFIRNII